MLRPTGRPGRALETFDRRCCGAAYPERRPAGCGAAGRPRRPAGRPDVADGRRGAGCQNRVSGPTGIGSRSAATSGTRARTSSWNRRASASASALSGVWTNTVGERPSRSQPASDVEPGLPALDGARRVVAADVADDRLAVGAAVRQRQARLLRPRLPLGVAGRRGRKNSVVSKGTHSAAARRAPLPAGALAAGPRRRRGADLDRVPVLGGRRRRKPARRAESPAPKDAGSWIHRAWARRPERLDRGQESPQRRVGVDEPALVGDRPRQLEDEPEVRVGLPGPGRHRVQGRGRVEGGVALHRVAPARVGPQPLPRRQRMGDRACPARPGGSTSRSRRVTA